MTDLIPEDGIDARAELRAYRADLVHEAVRRSSSWRQAAKLLGLGPATFQRWARDAGVAPPPCRARGTAPRDVLEMRALQRVGYSQAAIAEMTGHPRGTVRAALAEPDADLDQAASVVGCG